MEIIAWIKDQMMGEAYGNACGDVYIASIEERRSAWQRRTDCNLETVNE